MVTQHEIRQQTIQIIAGGGIVATDFDGCASEYHNDPEAAYPVRGFVSQLQALGAEPGMLVITISGRPPRLTELGKKGIEDFYRAGETHTKDPTTGELVTEFEDPIGTFTDTEGLEYMLPDGREGRLAVIANHGKYMDSGLIETAADEALRDELFSTMSGADRKLYMKLERELPQALEAAFPDFPVTYAVDTEHPDRIYLERKPEGIAVHVRTLAQQHPEQAAEILGFADRFYRERSQAWGQELHATSGTQVLDIQVRKASKGDPIEYLKAKFPGRRKVVIGDDVTDMNAFAALEAGDVAIAVGDRLPSMLQAEPLPDGVEVLYLDSPTELVNFLRDAAASTAQPSGQAQAPTAARTWARQHAPGRPDPQAPHSTPPTSPRRRNI